eukprot:Skav213608  [mRNA]  locus=scaffold1971:113239:115468:+ [translate_table: standard]
MANVDVEFVDSWNRENGEKHGALTFEEACVQVNGQKLNGPLRKPLKSDRPVGDITLGDLPVRNLCVTGGKLEQFADVILNIPVDASAAFWDNTIYNLCAQAKYCELPDPFRPKPEPTVPYSLQIFMLPSTNPPNEDQQYFHVFKRIYMHKNKLSSEDCVDLCHGCPLKFDWGSHPRVGLMALNLLQDGLGGKQISLWHLSARFEKKLSLDQLAHEEGYRFIRNFGPRSNNRNQFMEWADEQVHLRGGKLEGWPEAKVLEALNNYYRGRQNAKTLEFWPLTLKGFVAWFLDDVLVKMLPTMRQHSITWIGRTRVGKSLGSKTVLFGQSKYEIEAANRRDLAPSIVTAKYLDFFKAEPVTKFKPGVFDDGLLQKMDVSQTMDAELAKKINAEGIMDVSHADFLAFLAPSFTGIEDPQDMAAILARTHLIVLTDNGVYYRIASTEEKNVDFIKWPNSNERDLLAPAYRPVFQAYKKNPSDHTLPEAYHADSAWSQELLRRLLNGARIPRTVTTRSYANVFGETRAAAQEPPQLLSDQELKAKVKTEQCNFIFRKLKNFPIGHIIDLDSPSPAKKMKPACLSIGSGSSSSALPSVCAPLNPDNLPGMEIDEDDAGFLGVGEGDDLQRALEEELDQMRETEP